MTPYNKIFQLHAEGKNNSEIAKLIPCARSTVTETMKRAKEYSFIYPSNTIITDIEIHRILHPPKKCVDNYSMPNIDKLICKAGLPDSTIIKEWKLYSNTCINAGKKAYSKTAVYDFIKDALSEKTAPKYCNALNISFWRNKLPYYENGKTRQASLLLFTLEYSHYCFATVLKTFNQEVWINAHTELLYQIGGIATLYIYQGKMSSLVKNETLNFLNYHYMDFAEKPDLYQKFPNEILNDLETPSYQDISNAVAVWCRTQNNYAWLKNSCFTRSDAFLLEKPYLFTLPDTPFTTYGWIAVTPHINIHVYVMGHYYSIPYHLRHEQLMAKITEQHIEIYYNDNFIYQHERLKSANTQYQTELSHMPQPWEIPWGEWSGKRLLKWANSIGPYTTKVVNNYLKRGDCEQQGYKSSLAVLNLSNTYNAISLEQACTTAWRKHKKIEGIPYRNIKEQCKKVHAKQEDYYEFT